MSRLSLVTLLSILAVCQSRMAFEFSDGVESLLRSPLDNSFTCDQRIYGYYADISNNCQVFHVCLPLQDDDGNVVDVAQFSFLCGNQTVFSQESLTCTYPEEALPCDESESLFDISNSEFGIIDNTGSVDYQN